MYVRRTYISKTSYFHFIIGLMEFRPCLGIILWICLNPDMKPRLASSMRVDLDALVGKPGAGPHLPFCLSVPLEPPRPDRMPPQSHQRHRPAARDPSSLSTSSLAGRPLHGSTCSWSRWHSGPRRLQCPSRPAGPKIKSLAWRDHHQTLLPQIGILFPVHPW